MLNQDAIDALKDLGEHISAARADAVKSFHINMDELVVMAERDHIVGLLRFLREDPQCDFETLIDICGVDYPERILTDLPAARAKTVRALLDMRARALHRNDAGGYDLIELPLTGQTTRVFTKQEFRLSADGTSKLL